MRDELRLPVRTATADHKLTAMALFKVDGWSIDSKEIAYDKANKNDKQKAKKNKSKNKEKRVPEKPQLKLEEAPTDTQDRSPEQRDAPKIEKPKPAKRKHEEEANNSAADQTKMVEAPVSKKPLTALQKKMMAKLSGSRFRWINERLYTISSEDAYKLIQEQPQLFDEYHEGFRSQVQAWPENPVDLLVQQIRARAKKPVNAPGGLPGLKNKKIVIADMGCGEAQLALDVNTFFQRENKRSKFKKDCEVHSFDLKKANERITVADIRHVPLPENSCTIVIFCLALMGTNFLDFIKEAYRILAPRGELWIAEIKSRFSDGNGDEFVNALKLCGFFHKHTDNSNKMFTKFEFFKPPKEILEERKAKLERKQKFIEVETEKEALESKRSENPEGNWLLKPCIYKRR
ncbi:AGR152Wp [Eremothecium gossypii ATCC 10895]|uniref:Ribosomal RNA-processing protein 8 n=1 Tax=Eremothecium gossypii (strain ATCC 10895 / CBS 109.51 / FGSC 9923 / NRRL Y-1056) TaxID=284811 RepID=Q74ZP6_EREGS|nr:AGR152Wp [Eremothecium gossypii ATCC 10895]AAS54642.1 AGR152Wp [Eremothecium gossypii ATCC 10895]